jgi:hypothetical protein
MTDFDPSLIFGEDLTQGGIRKFCTDRKRCGLGIACEHGTERNESCELVSLWGGSPAECPNFLPRKELNSENDVFRPKGRKRHNQLNRSNPLIDPKSLPAPPDLMVSRHIKDGKNIKGED